MTNQKIFILSPHENWICDRFVNEFKQYYNNIVENPEEADIIWILADWCWKSIDYQLLKRKKVIVTVHHIVPSKFLTLEQEEFFLRDKIVDVYHVPCQKTKEQIQNLTLKNIISIPFWVNTEIWKKLSTSKKDLRKKYSIDENCYLIGSFQRDTEGKDLISPKLEKGPDIFCKAVEKISQIKRKENIETKVLLAGWRRQYVMKRLNELNVSFYYAELPSFDVINDFYNCIDLYVVGSRFEGGPQSIVECAATKTPIISTDVGIASEILSRVSIFREDTIDVGIAESNISFAYDKVSKLLIPAGFSEFINLFNIK